ncbi:MAG: methyltransferase [Agarilytica sp.]
MYQSKSVNSNQDSVHDNLESTVLKHIACPYLKPFRDHNLDAFARLKNKISELAPKRLILDSCCGTAMSSLVLAEKHQDALVVGVDQSGHRLNKSPEGRPHNCLLLQANCEDVWRLCVEENIEFDAHYILYPNPWPKSTQMKRRWHGHAVFPVLKPLSQKTVLRSNWDVYLQEFAFAWKLLTGVKAEVNKKVVTEAMTLFEKKYVGSGQEVYELEVLSRDLG